MKDVQTAIVCLTFVLITALVCAAFSQAQIRLLETIQEMKTAETQESEKTRKTFDLRDFPPIEEDQPTICTPEDLDDDPTDPYKPGVPANAGAEPEVQVSTSRLLRI